MEGWTDRSEEDACCPNSPGPVASHEVVARLNAVLPAPPGIDFFPRNELLPPKNGEIISNICGEQHGYSVTRRGDRTDDQIAAVSTARAVSAGKEPLGTLAGPVDNMRAFRLAQIEGQVVFVYDDPTDDDNLHAIIRVRGDLSRGRVVEVREALKQLLSHHISALPAPLIPK